MNNQLIDQEFNERRYSRKHIDGYICEELMENAVIAAKIIQGTAMVYEWMDWVKANGYASKQRRVEQLKDMDIAQLVLDIFTGIAYFQKEELFTSVTAQLAGRLGFSDKVEAITTVAELVAILCRTDAFDILRAKNSNSLVVVSRMPLSVSLIDHIECSQYLPPMVCEPRKLTSNFSSGYLTHNDSLILGNGNHHDGDICLDVLNTMNAVPLALCTEMLCQLEEKPTFEIDTIEKADQWKQFKVHSYRFYNLIVSQGNRFWLTNKVDKRGRIYSQGYHINTQGAAFKKAMIELADTELVEGVP